MCIGGILECRGTMLLYLGDVVVGHDMSQSLTHDGLRFDSEFPLKLEAVLWFVAHSSFCTLRSQEATVSARWRSMSRGLLRPSHPPHF